jgi:hypothetical protein
MGCTGQKFLSQAGQCHTSTSASAHFQNILAFHQEGVHNCPMNEEEFRKESRALIKEKIPNTPDEHIELHQDSSYYWGPENFSQVSDWLRTTIEILENPNNFSNRDLFINFFGVIDPSELPSFMNEKAVGSLSALGYNEQQARTAIATSTDLELKQYFQLIWEAKDLFEPIQFQFSEDDLFLLRFLRHRNCHITLSKFSVKIEGVGEDAIFKTANWERLVRLSESTAVITFRESLITRLLPDLEGLRRIQFLLSPERGKPRLFPE